MHFRLPFAIFLLLAAVNALTQQPTQNHALLFAVSTYEKAEAYPPLLSPVEEVRSLARVLERVYGFQTEVVENPAARQIEEKLAEYAARFADGTYAPEGQLLAEVMVALPDTPPHDKEILIDIEQDPDINDFVFVEEVPRVLNYDSVRSLMGEPVKGVLKRREHKGQNILVYARILVGNTGKYKRHSLILAGHPICNERVEEHIHKLVFTPAIQRGKPISFWVNVPFTFQVE